MQALPSACAVCLEEDNSERDFVNWVESGFLSDVASYEMCLL